MAKKLRIDVVLTPTAIEALASYPLAGHLRDGKYFNCLSVEQDGYFLHLDMLETSPGGTGFFRASIPVSYVLYMVSAAHQAELGFKHSGATSGTQREPRK